MLKIQSFRPGHLIALLAAAAFFGSAGSASAVLITYDIHQGNDDGFGYSEIHKAYEQCDYMCGRTKTKINGQLSFEYSDGVYTVAGPATLEGDTRRRWNGKLVHWSLEITGGAIDSNGGGTLDYVLSKGKRVSEGTFRFDGNLDMGPANGMDHETLHLWGWNADSTFGDIGIDLGGSASSSPVPEPSAALVFGLGALALGRGVRRR